MLKLTPSNGGGYRVYYRGECVGDIYRDGPREPFRFWARERAYSEFFLYDVFVALRRLNRPAKKLTARIKALHASVERTGRDYVPMGETTCPF